MNRQLVPDSISRSIRVNCPIETAFDIWTRKIASWWPAGHSLSGRVDTELLIEDRVGGRFFERTADGVEYDWGRVILWEPPHRLSYDWYLGSDPERPSRVHIRFTQQEDGVTRVDVEHRGPELLGDRWLQRSQAFSESWDAVLSAYTESM